MLLFTTGPPYVTKHVERGARITKFLNFLLIL